MKKAVADSKDLTHRQEELQYQADLGPGYMGLTKEPRKKNGGVGFRDGQKHGWREYLCWTWKGKKKSHLPGSHHPHSHPEPLWFSHGSCVMVSLGDLTHACSSQHHLQPEQGLALATEATGVPPELSAGREPAQGREGGSLDVPKGKIWGLVQTQPVSCFRNGMMPTYQQRKVAQSAKGTVQGSLEKRQLQTRDGMGVAGTGRMPSDSHRGQQSKETWAGEPGRMGGGAAQGDGRILHMTLSTRQAIRGVTIMKCMVLFPPQNSACVQWKGWKEKHVRKEQSRGSSKSPGTKGPEHKGHEAMGSEGWTRGCWPQSLQGSFLPLWAH